MYNDNYPNNFDGSANQTDNGRTDTPEGQRFTNTEPGGQNQGGGYQEPSGRADGGANYQNRQDSYPHHNYYDERYRSGANEGQGNRGGMGGGSFGGGGGNSGGGYPAQGAGSPKKPDRAGKIVAAVALVAVFAAFCVGLSWMAVNSVKDQLASIPVEQESEAADQQQIQDQAAGQPAQEQIAQAGTIRESGEVTAVVTDVTDVVEKVMPASVSITNNFTQQVQDFWGQTYSQDEQASGSGIIIGQNEKELLIVTNNHVVDGADALHVQFIDGENAEAQVKGTNSSVDLAVLAVALDDISASTRSAICVAQMGDSDSLKIGEPAIAIGNALGYGQSVTTGVISALNRTLEVTETGTSNALIQTDAAINPGNSGGALLNMNGEVIGINSNKIGGTVVEGMGYAIPISTAKPIIEELMTHETMTKVADEERGYLGISCINVTSDLSQTFNMPEGVFVAQVYEGTGAARAGLVRGDIVTAINGTAVASQADLTRQMQYYKAGQQVEITIMQGSPTGYKAKNVQVTLSSYEELEDSSQQEQQTRP